MLTVSFSAPAKSLTGSFQTVFGKARPRVSSLSPASMMTVGLRMETPIAHYLLGSVAKAVRANALECLVQIGRCLLVRTRGASTEGFGRPAVIAFGGRVALGVRVGTVVFLVVALGLVALGTERLEEVVGVCLHLLDRVAL